MSQTTAGSRYDDTAPRWLRVAAVVVAAAAQIVVLVPFTLSSGLVAPLWAIVLLVALWLACTALLVAVARRRPLLAPLIPVGNFALWWLALMLGGQVLGWTP